MTCVPLFDTDLLAAGLPPRIAGKLFENRRLDEGTRVAVRLNLNGKVSKDGASYFIQTVHKDTVRGRALGYDAVVTVRNARFDVDQRARAAIATGRKSKFPMAAVLGDIVHGPADIEGVEVRFNPATGHLFTRVDNGLAVRSADEVTIFNTRCYVRGAICYWEADEAPMALENLPSDARFPTAWEAAA